MPAPRVIDFAPLKRLLTLAGPTGASPLVDALLDDLKATQTHLTPAWNGPDFAALRTDSHVLIALAGTIGDTYLHELAQHLNAAAHTENLIDLMDMKPKIMAGLTDLIAQLPSIKGE